MKLYISSYGQWPDNCACLFASLASGFYLVNVVVMNLCHTTTNIHNNIVCLPSNVPPESIIMTMLMVLMVQIVARGVSRAALMGSWMICLIAINVAIYLSGNSNYIWINVLLLLIICISYELERQPLCQFINTAKAMEAVKVSAGKCTLAIYPLTHPRYPLTQPTLTTTLSPILATYILQILSQPAELEVQLSVYKTLLADEALEAKRSLVSLDF